MAKRRKLQAPSAAELNQIEQDYRRATTAAPIAQVAAESAGLLDARDTDTRTAEAKDQADAARLRQAEQAGLVMLELPLSQIRPDALVRDRVALDAEAMDELRNSIAKGGLRLPIEVFETPQDPDFAYGLLSGYRRLAAMQALCDMVQGELWTTIKAIVRQPETMGGTFAAMIEENEMRAGLSHYERGRISVIAAQQGAYVNVEEAVNALFPQASKAKRSKIRSFAMIFEELGDLLVFPDLMKERIGLQIAAALRDGAEIKLRDALADHRADTPDEETNLLLEALANLTPKTDPKRGGRPKKAPPPRRLSSGMSLQSGEDTDGWFIRVNGRNVDRDLIERAMEELERLLGSPRR